MKTLIITLGVLSLGFNAFAVAETGEKSQSRTCVQQANARAPLSDQCQTDAESYGDARRVQAESAQQRRNRACVQQANAGVLSKRCTKDHE